MFVGEASVSHEKLNQTTNSLALFDFPLINERGQSVDVIYLDKLPYFTSQISA